VAAVQVGGAGVATMGLVCSGVKVAAVMAGSGTSVKVVAVIKAATVVVQLQW